MLESCMRPELVAEITLQPVRRHDVDAAIYFSDIVVPLKAIGIDLDIKPGVGPVVEQPDPHPRRPRPAARPRPPRTSPTSPRRSACSPRELGATPLIGFAGAPFTLASYLVEGGPSRNHEHTKAMMYGDPRAVGRPARPPRRHHRRLPQGADRGGRLARSSSSTPGPARSPRPTTAARCCPPPRRSSTRSPATACRASTSASAPANCSASWARPARTSSASTGGSRWTRPPAGSAPARRSRATSTRPSCSPPREAVEAKAREVLDAAAGLEGHVFNLGHGVMPSTDPDALTRLVEYVHTQTAR